MRRRSTTSSRSAPVFRSPVISRAIGRHVLIWPSTMEPGSQTERDRLWGNGRPIASLTHALRSPPGYLRWPRGPARRAATSARAHGLGVLRRRVRFVWLFLGRHTLPITSSESPRAACCGMSSLGLGFPQLATFHDEVHTLTPPTLL